MATYVYDDFRVTFAPRDDGAYDVVAVDASSMQTAGLFELPLTEDELRDAVLRVARTTRAWAATRRRAEPELATRDVGEDRPSTLRRRRAAGRRVGDGAVDWTGRRGV